MIIQNKKIGSGESCFIIAEAGVNHNGDVKRALQMVETAAEAGADAVKFQTFDTDLIVSADAPKAGYQQAATGSEENQYAMLKKLELPKTAYEDIIKACRERDIIFMSTPFDETSVAFLERLGMPVFKIPSGELTNIPLLKCIAEKNKPIIMSTGMAEMAEIKAAVETITDNGNRDLALLQCTSNYPVKPADVNLRAMHLLAHEFGFPVGFSDHSLGLELAIAAVAMGACIVEKHFTLDKELPGPDHRMSLSPGELKDLVQSIRNVEKALGDGRKVSLPSEKNISEVARRSIHYRIDLPGGKILEENDVVMLRPGDGVSPADLNSFIGKRLMHDVVGRAKLRESDFRE